jgi:hypothetical protein
MLKINQPDNTTKYNRYPELFLSVKNAIVTSKTPNILSFGCSYGMECHTLSDIYFKNSNIVGLDIDKDIIANNRINNKNKKITFYDSIDVMLANNRNKKYDLIFALSVLCMWPPKKGVVYKFSVFEETIALLDSLLEVGGYLCIYNGMYLFEESATFCKYIPVDIDYKNIGFINTYHKPEKSDNDVPKLHYSHQSKDPNLGYTLFKKISV